MGRNDVPVDGRGADDGSDDGSDAGCADGGATVGDGVSC